MSIVARFAALWESVAGFAGDHRTALLGMGALLLLGGLVRYWPDNATRRFIAAGLRARRHQVAYLRADLADIVAEQGRRLQQVTAEHQLQIQGYRLERERTQYLVRSMPQLVREVGEALAAIEREYLAALQQVQSTQGREALRLSTEKRINDLLQMLNVSASATPAFSLTDLAEEGNHRSTPMDTDEVN